jgi:hypothetical protein
MQNALEMGNYMFAQLEALASKHPRLRHVRGRGLMIGFDVFPDSEATEPDATAATAVQDYCRGKGIITQFIQRNRFRVLPPLVVGKTEIDRYVSVLDDALAALGQGTIRPQPPENPHTGAFAAKRASGVRGALTWAWTHSPKHWVNTIRKKVKGRT